MKPAFPDHFALFWSVYPRRHGRRIGKRTTRELFDRLSVDDQLLAVQAAIAYSRDERVGRGYARDPERFLKKGWWRDWLEPISQQCATTGCEELAIEGLSRCAEHLTVFIRGWQARDQHGLSHPTGMKPPTPEEITYVESADRDPASAHSAQ